MIPPASTASPSKPAKRKAESWSSEKSSELYGVDTWGHGFFGVNKKGDVTVRLEDDEAKAEVSLFEVIDGLRDRGTHLPVLLRFRDLLHSRIAEINESFRKAIKETKYRGEYRGVYPIKVNQQRQVIEEITEFGKKYHYGLEAGSKPELIAALAHMHDPEAYLICNGYKDEEFIDLALQAQKMGLRIMLVLEMPSELDLILERSRKLGILPNLGVRVRLSTKGSGHWQDSAGDKSVFGLNASQVIAVVDQLKESGYMGCLKMLHYHQGSQIPNIAAIREGATEAVRMYCDLVKEGAPMGVLDIGGGMAVDYDGSHTNFHSSCNYSVSEYCTDIVEVISQICDKAGVAHPNLISESGRAVVAYYSVLVFNILDVTSAQTSEEAPPIPENAPQNLMNIIEVNKVINKKNLQECFNDAMYYRDQMRAQFFYGAATLRERGLAEAWFWHILTRISHIIAELDDDIPEDLRELSSTLVDFYYGNFSLFQSLPDSWAIDQVFPVMPIHRLNEKPRNRAVLADITCDCDGKIDRFIDKEDVAKILPLHDFKPGEPYYLAVFLVGAYQETLGDLHNLLGDTNVVGVHLEKGKPVYTHEVEGDTVADVLSYVEFDPKELVTRFRTFAEKAVTEGRISPKERREILDLFREGLAGYTYFES
ncbi:biosynthetic arginine decarboxylase [Luteolibacter yonseiensis]|uniref:Biosynthetic arginine decarboxylase n=1 Tax=Luteolibacter yonseiensis TaxID=1144680 RepID=A0A934R305_9BACT|nr:biosynthetic arginine decarboxylase [Luteolibacter yonseiensis]MBK1814560.1 biosynthetic arginine decarboxylase [Luteolibacter yonseiensis]